MSRYIVVDTDLDGNGWWSEEYDSKREAVRTAIYVWDNLSEADKEYRTVVVIDTDHPDPEDESHFDGYTVYDARKIAQWKADNGFFFMDGGTWIIISEPSEDEWSNPRCTEYIPCYSAYVVNMADFVHDNIRTKRAFFFSMEDGTPVPNIDTPFVKIESFGMETDRVFWKRNV